MRSHVSSARRTGLGYASSAVIALALALVVASPSVGFGQVKEILEEAYAKFEEGDHDGAVRLFENAFAQDPSNDVLFNWLQRVEMAAVYRMVRSDNERLSGIALQILRILRTPLLEKRRDEEEILSLIEEAMSDKDRRLEIMLRAAGFYGRNLVPYLIPYLGHKELDKRVTALSWVTKVGISAVPVLQAARKHPDPIVRVNVAKLLGTAPLRTSVNLATLKAMMEVDESEEVRAAAEESFEAVLNGGRVRPAKEYFLRNGYRYYLKPHENIFGQSRAYVPTIYSLRGDSVVGEAVAPFQFAERMAKQALEEAIELDPEYRAAYVVSLCNDAAQVVEYDWNLAYYAEQGADQNTYPLLLGQKPYIDHVLRLRLLAAPTDVVALGLNKALEDERSDVARKIIEVIRDTRRRGRVLTELVRALEDENSRLVRVAAAITLAEWNPTEDFDAGDMVVDILSDAVVSSGIRVIQKVMGDRSRANHFDDLFRELNMESYSPSTSIEEGYAAVLNSPPDAVLIDEQVSLEERPGAVAPINFFVTQLRKNYRTANVPVIVAVEESRVSAGKQLYESEERKVFVVPEGIDSLGLKNLVLDSLFEEKEDAKEQATRLAAEAAQALGRLAGGPHPLIPVESSAPSLVRVLRNRPDEVRIPCIRALGRIRRAEAAEELAVVYSDERNALDVRAAAMTAIGDALQESGGASDVVLRAIQEGMSSSTPELRRAAWYAFSAGGADGPARLSAMLASAPAEVAPVTGEADEPLPEPEDSGTLEGVGVDSPEF